MQNNKRIHYLNAIPILIIAFILYKVVDKLDLYINSIKIIKILSPVIWAFAIAYLLNPAMKFLEKRLRIRRGFIILLIYLVLIAIITAFIVFVSPSIFQSIGDIAEQVPYYFESTYEWVNTELQNFEALDKNGWDKIISDNIKSVIDTAKTVLTGLLSSVVTKAIDITSAFFKFIIALMIAFYFLNDKEKFKRGGTKLLYALFGRDIGKTVIIFARDIDTQFSNYIIGKTIDSIIIALIAFGGFALIGAPYAMLLALIVGITNMIPYFGPFIGAVPAVAITLFTSPKKALFVLIFMIIVQQFDGLYLGPKILGKQVGLSPLWIIIAIIVGGGMFGILGMLLGVPIMAVIRTIYLKFVDKKLANMNIDI